MPPKHSSSKSYKKIGTPDTDNATDIEHTSVNDSVYWEADYVYLHKRTYYHYLRDLNSGLRLGPKWYNSNKNVYDAAVDLIEAISSQLDLTPIQRAKARGRFTKVDRKRLGQRLELVAFSLCALVVEQDPRNKQRRCHPNIQEDKFDDVFEKVAQSIGVNEPQFRKMYGKLEHIFR